MSRKWKNWYQNEVYEETMHRADSRDNVKRNGRSDQLFLWRMMIDEGGRARVTTDEERVLRGR